MDDEEAVDGGAAPGAAFVKSFADLHVAIKRAVRKLRSRNSFGATLTCLESTLDRLAPVIKDVKQLDCPEKETRDLIRQMKWCEKLVQFLYTIQCWKLDYESKKCYKISKLVKNIVNFCLFDLQLLPAIGAQILKMVETHFPDFELEFKIFNITSGIPMDSVLDFFSLNRRGRRNGKTSTGRRNGKTSTAHGKSIVREIVNHFPLLSPGKFFFLPPLLEAAALPPFTSIFHPSETVVSLSMNSQWQRGNLIGRGGFGSVYIATNRNTPALCAIKEVEIFLDDKQSADPIKQLWQEIKLLSKLKHPNIVQYYDSEIVDNWFRIYMEYVPGGSIRKYIIKYGAIPESDVRWFTFHILSGLVYLHSKNIVHRDIKGFNLLIDSSGVVKLADFGTAKHLAPHADAAKLYMIGSERWMAPELVRGLMSSSSNAALAVDIWSVGCSVLEMLTGRLPWDGVELVTVIYRLGKGMTPPIPETLSPLGKEFLSLCLKINPADRRSAANLLEHPFVKKSDQLDGN